MNATWWRHMHAAQNGFDVSFEPSEIERWFRDPFLHAGAKTDLPAWSPARFKDGRRALANVMDVSMLVVDIDEPQASPSAFFERVARALPSVAFFAHSSFSSEPNAFKFRVVVPLDAPVDSAAFPLLWARVARMLEREEIAVDAQAKDASRLFFVPAIPPCGAYEWHARTGDAFPAQMAIELELIAREREERERVFAFEEARKIRETSPRGCGVDTVERARRYVERMDPAISGSGGHTQTFKVACVLVRGFALGANDTWNILADYNLRCSPPWSERDLRRKLEQAAEHARIAEGYLLEGSP